MLLAMVIVDLDKAGVVSRTDFAARLRKILDDAEREAPPEFRGKSRLDLQIGRLLADSIDPPENNKGTEGWTPVVYSNPEKSEGPDR
jgi:hypothetical protein